MQLGWTSTCVFDNKNNDNMDTEIADFLTTWSGLKKKISASIASTSSGHVKSLMDLLDHSPVELKPPNHLNKLQLKPPNHLKQLQLKPPNHLNKLQ